MALIDMQTIRYINLLDKISRVKTMKCFNYNSAIIFAVPERMISRALGPNASNIRYLQEQLGKRVRIVAEPSGISDAEKFARAIVAPVSFKSLDIKEGMFILDAGSQNKAALIGRNKRRLDELNKIMQDNFGMEVKIV